MPGLIGLVVGRLTGIGLLVLIGLVPCGGLGFVPGLPGLTWFFIPLIVGRYILSVGFIAMLLTLLG
jgi:hypothetical protein